MNVLSIQSSGRSAGSTSRALSEQVIDRLAPAQVVTRELAAGIPFVDEAWIGANFTPPEERTAEHKEILAFSETLVEELEAADTIVIGAPIYNFGVPAVLKALGRSGSPRAPGRSGTRRKARSVCWRANAQLS